MAGTSIGAINAAFIVQGDFGKLEQLYSDIDISDVIETNAEIGENRNLFKLDNIVKVARDFVKQKGFNNEPLKELLEQNLDIDAIYRSEMDFGMVTYSVKNHKPLGIYQENFLPEESSGTCWLLPAFPFTRHRKSGKTSLWSGGCTTICHQMMIKKVITALLLWIFPEPGLKKRLVKKGVYIKLIRWDGSLGGSFN